MSGNFTIHAGDMPVDLSLIPREDVSADRPAWYVGNDRFYTIVVKDKRHVPIDIDILVKKGDFTDLASVPKFSLIQPVRFPRPALLHDIGYRYTIDEMIESGRAVITEADGDTRYTAKPLGANLGEKARPADFFLHYLRQDNYKNQKKFFDSALRYFCRLCPALSATAPTRIYYAVKLFGGGSFLNKTNRRRVALYEEEFRKWN